MIGVSHDELLCRVVVVRGLYGLPPMRPALFTAFCFLYLSACAGSSARGGLLCGGCGWPCRIPTPRLVLDDQALDDFPDDGALVVGKLLNGFEL
jgi:hypothetical protein